MIQLVEGPCAMRKTLMILDQELTVLMDFVGKIDDGTLTFHENGKDATAAHREVIFTLLKDLLEVRSRITMKISEHIDLQWQKAENV